MRKSARETRKPDVFTFPDTSNVKMKSDETDEEDNFESSQSTKKTVPKAKEFTVFNAVGGNGKQFNLIDIVSSNRNVTPEIAKWIDIYKTDKVKAMVELVNFVLMAAGSGKKWIAEDVDLESLEPEELDVLLSDMMKIMSERENSKDYPLLEKPKGKGSRSFRDKYKGFWLAWVEKLLALPRDNNTKRILGYEIVRTMIDQLVALSSMAVVNIRDSVTEASLSIAKSLLQSCMHRKDELITVNRQILAEEGGAQGRAKTTAVQNPKYQACLKQRDAVHKELEILTELCNTIFNSILLHRIKDFHEEVRTIAVQYVLEYIRFDLKRTIHVEYLKYLGWACSDYANSVRLEAIRGIHSLAGDGEVVAYLCSFVEVFVDRFIEIASQDVDDHVALEMVRTLRVMQSAGLLDTISEEKLDVVDAVVFDTDAPLRVRQEALAFLMDHTEGFDEDPEAADADNLPDIGSRTKGAKGKASAQRQTDQAKALERRQKAAQQLETLTEYAEHHLGASLDRAYMLGEACVALHKYGTVYNWSTIVALLLRESDDLISSALRPVQAAILLRMFVHCATDLNARRLALAEASALTSSERHTLEHWESLNNTLHTHLPALLTRFQDDEDSLAVLTNLLVCVDFTAQERAIKALLKVLLQLVEIIRVEPTLHKVVAALCQWTRLGGTIAGAVEVAVRDVLATCWQSILDGTVKLENLINTRSAGPEDISLKKNNKRKSKGSVVQNDKEEILLSLQNALMQLKAFWANIDCRNYLDVSVTELCDELAEVADYVPTFAEGEAVLLSDAMAQACISAASSAVAVIHNAVLWNYKDVLDLGRQMSAEKAAASTGGSKRKTAGSKKSSQSAIESDTEEEEKDEIGDKFERKITMAVDAVVVIREKLLDILMTWFSASTNNEAAADTVTVAAPAVSRALQLEAYRIVSDLRNFFPIRETQYRYIDRLAYAPSQEVLAAIRSVFETEGGRIKSELMSLNPQDPRSEHAVIELSNSLINCIIEPVSSNVIFDVEHLNRKQAAAVIYYILDANELIEDKIKAFMRRLKELNMMKYIEIQLIALRDLYLKNVTAPLQARAVAEDEEDSQFDFEENDQTLQDGIARVEYLSRKLAQSLGVAKFKDDALEQLLKFFKASIDFSLSDACNAGFITCLINYLRFLLPQSQREVLEYFNNALESNPDIADELDALRARSTDTDWQGRHIGFAKMSEFLERIQGKGRPKMTRRKSSTGTAFPGDESLLNNSALYGRSDTAKGRTTIPIGRNTHELSLASSQALMDEDLALLSTGGNYTFDASSKKRGSNSSIISKAGAAAKKMKQDVVKKAPKVAVKGSRQSARAAAGGSAKRTSYTEAESSEEEEEEVVEDSSSEQEDERDDYSGLDAGGERRYQQRFTQGLNSQSQTQKSTQNRNQREQGTRKSASSRGAATAGIVMGLDIEDLEEDIEEDSPEEVPKQQQAGHKRGYGSMHSDVSLDSNRRALPSVAESFAELDSIPSRRRLR